MAKAGKGEPSVETEKANNGGNLNKYGNLLVGLGEAFVELSVYVNEQENLAGEGRKSEEELKGDKLDASDTGGKVERGRSPPSGGNLDTRVFGDLLADDGDDSDDSNIDASNKMKVILSGGAIRHYDGSLLATPEDNAGRNKTEPDERRALPPPCRTGMNRARSARSLSPRESPMKRTGSGDANTAAQPMPSISRAISTGGRAAATECLLLDAEGAPPPRPRSPLGRARSERSLSPRRPVNRTGRGDAKTAALPTPSISCAVSTGGRAAATESLLLDAGGAPPPRPRRARSERSLSPRRPMNRSQSGDVAVTVPIKLAPVSTGPALSDVVTLLRKTSAVKRTQSGGVNGPAPLMPGMARAVTTGSRISDLGCQSSSRPKVSRTKSGAEARKASLRLKVSSMQEDLFPAMPGLKRATSAGENETAPSSKGGRLLSGAQTSQNFVPPEGRLDSTTGPEARISAPTLTLSPKERSCLDVGSLSEHIPRKKPIRIVGNDSRKRVESSDDDDRKSRSPRRMKTDGTGRRSPKSYLTTGDDSKQKAPSAVDDHQPRPSMRLKTDSSCVANHRRAKDGSERNMSPISHEKRNTECSSDAEGKESKMTTDSGVHQRRRRSPHEAREADGGVDHSSRRDTDRRRARRPKEESKRSPMRTQSGGSRSPDEEVGEEAARVTDDGFRRPRRRGDEEKSDRDLSPEASGEDIAMVADSCRRKPRRTRSENKASSPEGRTLDISPRRERAPTAEAGRSQGRRCPKSRSNSRGRKTGARRPSTIARNQYANMVKYAQELEEEEVVEEEEEEMALREEERMALESSAPEERIERKQGLFKSAFGAVAHTAKLGVKVASATTKMGAGVASAASKTTVYVARSTGKAAVSTAIVAKSTGIKVVDSLGVNSQHGKGRMEEDQYSDKGNHAKRRNMPVASISLLVGPDLCDDYDDNDGYEEDDFADDDEDNNGSSDKM